MIYFYQNKLLHRIVRSDALAAFIANYTKLMDFGDWSLQATSDSAMKARLQTVKVVTSTFPFRSAVLLVK